MITNNDVLKTTLTPRRRVDKTNRGKWDTLQISKEEYEVYLQAELYHILAITEEAEDVQIAALKTARYNSLLSKRIDDPTVQKYLDPYDNLVAALAKRGLMLVNVPGDGNCQFRAVSDQLSTTKLPPKTYQQLRQEAADYIENKNLYKEFEGPDAAQNVYVANMRKPGEWGDNFTLLALARKYNLTIIVVQDDGSVFKIHDGKQTITLGYLRNLHYTSTKKR